MKSKYLFSYYTRELIKTKKIYILLITFLVLGIYPPVLTYYEPILMQQFINEYHISYDLVPKINFIDSYYELFDVLNQIGILLTMCFTITGIISDKKNGNMSVFFVNGLSRKKYLLTLFLNRSVIFTGFYLMAFLSCMGYCKILFNESFAAITLYSLILCLGYMLLYISISILLSIYINSTLIQFLSILIIYLLGKIITSIPTIRVISYGQLMDSIQLLLANNCITLEAITLLIFYLTLSFAILIVTGVLFTKKEMW